jgi:uncharacterized protein (TIGR02687 family)
VTDLSSIQPHLERLFENQRIVMWSDPDDQFYEEFKAVQLPGVEAVQIEGNEYAVKHRMLREEPKGKFLVYRAGPVPADIDNWLLDLELAFGRFSADKVSLLQQKLGLEGPVGQKVVAEHPLFFRSAKRTEELKVLLQAADDADTVRAKMVAILVGQTEHRMIDITRALLRENAKDKATAYALLEETGLAEFHWKGVARIYGYTSPKPSVDDFVLWAYRTAMSGFASNTPDALRNIQLDFETLRHDYRERATFEVLARRVARDLDVQASIAGGDFRDLIDRDLFEVIDAKIISDLANGIANRTLSSKEVTEWVRRRQNCFWSDGYTHLYLAIDAASRFLNELDTLDLSIQSFDDGLLRYTTGWYVNDQLYRQFVLHGRLAEHQGPLEDLRVTVESFHSNKYLVVLGNSWQKQVDAVVADDGVWGSFTVDSQTDFYVRHVGPVVKTGRKKMAVIISDALRYEIADELRSRIRQEDRYEADLGYMLSVLPSYTQLGMAALLPHQKLEHAQGDKALVLADGKPSGGVANRNKILATVDGVAVQAEEFLKMSRDEQRELSKSHQVIYVYHNRIDETGDNPKSEGRVFEETERTFAEIIDLVKKLANANATNIIVTADHGFLYQDDGLDESDYLSVQPQGDEILFRDRRFVLGRGLKSAPEFTTFMPAQLGLDGDVEVQIPKSINRLRRQGSGSRFVHGGASLQEVVVPVLTINKKRNSDLTQVSVEILPESNTITTGQMSVKLFQQDQASDKVQARTLRAGLYVGEMLISNLPVLVFDLSAEDKRDRYIHVQLVLSRDADDHNNRTVELRLEEQIPKTNQWRVYKKAVYTLKRSFMSDFDF